MSFKHFCTQEIHDSCRCILEGMFHKAAKKVIEAKNWPDTKIAMLETHPIAETCIAIDAGVNDR